MQGGDISNQVPGRAIVVVDCILDRETVVDKVLGFINVPREEVRYNMQALAQFWRFSAKMGYSMELVGYGFSQKEMDQVLEDLDNLGTNPFNYAKAFNVVADLVAQLPYRPEVVCVVDVPERALRYGRWFLDLARV